MEARESQRDLMQQAATEDSLQDGVPAKPSTSEDSVCFEEEEKKPFLDLAVREIIQNRSTATSLASLACPDKHVLDEDIEPVDKESQVKDQPNNFKGVYVYPYPCKDPHPPTKKRRH